MNKQDTELVIHHLEYIRKRVDAINGRVRDNEKVFLGLRVLAHQ